MFQNFIWSKCCENRLKAFHNVAIFGIWRTQTLNIPIWYFQYDTLSTDNDADVPHENVPMLKCDMMKNVDQMLLFACILNHFLQMPDWCIWHWWYIGDPLNLPRIPSSFHYCYVTCTKCDIENKIWYHLLCLFVSQTLYKKYSWYFTGNTLMTPV